MTTRARLEEPSVETLHLRIGALENRMGDHDREITSHHWRVGKLEHPKPKERVLRWRIWRYLGLVRLRRTHGGPLLNITRMEHVPGWGIYTPRCYFTLERKPYRGLIVVGRRKS